MKLHLERFGYGKDSTLGRLTLDGTKHICYTIEDERRDVKVPGETRIPIGRYELVLRTDSPKFAHYFKRWKWFQGMPLYVDVAGDGEGFEILHFDYVMAHPGTTADDLMFGDWSRLLMVNWGMLTIEASRVANDALQRRQTHIVAHQDVDFIITKPDAFCIATGWDLSSM